MAGLCTLNVLPVHVAACRSAPCSAPSYAGPACGFANKALAAVLHDSIQGGCEATGLHQRMQPATYADARAAHEETDSRSRCWMTSAIQWSLPARRQPAPRRTSDSIMRQASSLAEARGRCAGHEAYSSFLAKSEGGGLGRKQVHSMMPKIVHTPASPRTAWRAHSGFSSRIGSQGGTHGNVSVKDAWFRVQCSGLGLRESVEDTALLLACQLGLVCLVCLASISTRLSCSLPCG